MQKVVTIPKIITPTSSSGVQRKESCQGSRTTKTPVPTETNSWPSLDKLKRAKPKDVKTSQSAPSGCRRKPVLSSSAGGRCSKQSWLYSPWYREPYHYYLPYGAKFWRGEILTNLTNFINSLTFSPSKISADNLPFACQTTFSRRSLSLVYALLRNFRCPNIM